MRKRFTKLSPAFYALAAAMAAITLLCIALSTSWVRRPFAGFLVYDPPYVGSMSLKDWPGTAAGLRFLERVVSVDGKPVVLGRQVAETAAGKGAGTPLSFVLEHKGSTREVTLPVTEFGFRDYVLTFVLNLLGGAVVYALGCIVYVMKPRTASSRAFLALCFFLGTYIVSSFEILSTYRLVRLHYLSLSFMGTALFHLGLVFPERKQILVRRPRLQYWLYLPAACIAVGYQAHAFAYPELLPGGAHSWLPGYKTLGTSVRILTLACTLGMFVAVFHAYFRASSAIARQRARVILLGAGAAFIPCAGLQMGFFLFKIDFPWNFLIFFILIFPAAVAYSIARHNLFDTDAIVRRTVGYVVVTAVLVGLYSVVLVALNVSLGSLQLAQSRAFPMLFIVGVVLFFNPLRNRVQSLVDRFFFKAEYSPAVVVDKVGRAITSLLDLGEVLKRLTGTLVEDMFLESGSVLLLDASGAGSRVYAATGGARDGERQAVGRDHPLIRIVEEEKREITRYDVLEDPKYRSRSGECAAGFDALGADLVVPLMYQDRLIGTLNLGEKKSGKFYNRVDVDLLRNVASQGAVAIENARLFHENLEKQRMEEELAIARDLQQSMLPATCPRIEGFEIAARSMSAKEVGGDFYDFIELGDGRVGFVVGDVAGKGVSGALVMSSSRSIFRMLSEERMDIGAIMTRANRRTKTDIRPGMFVALLFAVLDSRDRTLRLCSAGQVQPVLAPGRGGAARLVETQGDTFPLGILGEARYEETAVPLAPGDRLVFYTDGIVEAMNPAGEIFGFERLLAVVGEARAGSAGQVLQAVLDAVAGFAAGAAQHDDLTVIAVSVAG